MVIQQFVVGPVMTNCYLLGDEATHEAAFIDPGEQGERLAREAHQQGWHVAAILLTHAHFDHIAGVKDLLSCLVELQPGEAVPVYVHPTDYPEAPASFGRGITLENVPNVRHYRDGDQVQVGKLTVTVIGTPGHTRGGVTLQVEDALFTGDTLFAGSCGRTDFATSSQEDMMASLKKLAQLDGDYRVYPGHEDTSTLDWERQHNIFVRWALQDKMF